MQRRAPAPSTPPRSNRALTEARPAAASRANLLRANACKSVRSGGPGRRKTERPKPPVDEGAGEALQGRVRSGESADGDMSQQRRAPYLNPREPVSRPGVECPTIWVACANSMRLEGHTAIVHTAAASNLGKMLTPRCIAEGVPLVNIVRSQDHADVLRAIAARCVIDIRVRLSSPTSTTRSPRPERPWRLTRSAAGIWPRRSS
jgi:hypothetical protein